MTFDGEFFEVYRGWIINPGITMPAQGIHDFNVYLTREEVRNDEPRYMASSLEDARRWIDEQETGLEKREALGIMEVIEKLPFMPEKGPPLPEYVGKELYGLEAFKTPVSDYGAVVVSRTAEILGDFAKAGNFVVIGALEETGWASDSIAYNGVLRHLPSGTEWDVEVWVNFEWRKPGSIESMFIDFLSCKKLGEEPIPIPVELVGTDKWTFDLMDDEGVRAGSQAQDYLSKGWNV